MSMRATVGLNTFDRVAARVGVGAIVVGLVVLIGLGRPAALE